MNKRDIMEFLSGLFSTVKAGTKFFNNDGSPATEISENREFLIHENDVKEAFDSLVKNNNVKVSEEPIKFNGKLTNEIKASILENSEKIKPLPVTEVIEIINDPKKVTESDKDSYGLTSDQRRWLLEFIFSVEGGYFNHPNDPGGETMYGIIKTEARANGYNGPMKDLPKEVATEIYLRKYWKNMKLEQINDFRKALCIFDFIVNSGNRGIKVAQRVVNKVYLVKSKLASTKKKYANLNTISVDGVLGPKTIEAINMIDTDEFLMMYMFLQEDTYEDLMRANSKLRSFDEGWENRIATKILYLVEMGKVMK